MPDEPRLEELLLEWENAETAGRPVAVETLCGDCPELAEDLRRRIHILQSLSGVLDTSACEDDAPEPTEVKPLSPPPGFILLQQLARGGMGVVYKAWQLGDERMVALKMILVGKKASQILRERFQTETRAASRLRHPNIVQVYKVDTHQDVPYMAMEFVPGGNLQTLLEHRRLTPLETAALLETLARAIHFAHQQGIVHRDLKPANILLQDAAEAYKGPLHPKIADFGLAKQLDQTHAITPTGTVLGTPGYMAPEQAAAIPSHIGPATDIFSLGVIMFELLTGTLPFGINSNVRANPKPPSPPSMKNAACPAALDAICLRCLRLEPGERYASALDLAEDLRRFQMGSPAGENLTQRKPAPAGPPFGLMLGFGLVLFLLGIFVAVWILWNE